MWKKIVITVLCLLCGLSLLVSKLAPVSVTIPQRAGPIVITVGG
jgi:hypothetical protein